MLKDTTIPIEQWGRDHWSTFAYVAHWCREYGAEGKGFCPAAARHRQRMRCDAQLHPAFAHAPGTEKYPTLLHGGIALPYPHDDYSCIDDMGDYGLFTRVGTGIAPVLHMTDKGLRVSNLLSDHRTRGGSFETFRLWGSVGVPVPVPALYEVAILAARNDTLETIPISLGHLLTAAVV